jgi:hypothetical protein
MLAAMTAAIVVGLPSVAFAKGEMLAVQGKVMITGPGLSSPIHLAGEVSGSEGFLWASERTTEFSTFVTATPLVSTDSSLGWFELKPADPASLGPPYTVRYRFEYEDGAVSELRHVLYPYAPDGPLLHIPAEQGLSGRHVDLWWRASSGSMVAILRAHGLPAEAPPGAAAPPPAAVPGWMPAVGADAAWIWSTAAAGLLALIVAAVVLGRRRAVGRA